MIILLLLYFVFLLIYMAFNAYGLIRISKTRIKGDAAGLFILIYVIAIAIIIFITLVNIGQVSWGAPNMFKNGGLL